MKKLILIFLLAFSCSTFAQTIRRCNDNPNVTGVNIYATIQAAHDAAVVGDIIYLEPGSYGSLISTKRLTIIGNGLAQAFDNYSTTPNPPLDGRLSTISNFSMRNGSQNSVIIGVYVAGNGNTIRVPNITIDRCMTGTIIFEATDISIGLVGRNATITRCRFITVMTFSQGTIIGSNCLITNNIVDGSSNQLVYLNNSIIRNNIFTNSITVSSSVVADNIFSFPVNVVSVNDYNTPNTNSISNNLAVATNGLPTGNGNINGATSSSIFTTSNIGGTTPPDSGYQLAVGSPAIGTGTSGANMGIFAGASPFVLAGLPPRPIITNFISSGVGNSSTPLQVSVTVRGNN